MNCEEVARLLELDRLPARLDLVQTAPEWCAQEQWMLVRDRLDAAIFSRIMCQDELVLRRIVFLEPAPGAGSDVAGEHRRWVSGLVRDLYYLDMPRHGERARYRIRQLIRDPHAAASADVADGWSDGARGAWEEAFERTWSTPRCIESNLVPDDFPEGPRADRDPRWQLWR